MGAEVDKKAAEEKAAADKAATEKKAADDKAKADEAAAAKSIHEQIAAAKARTTAANASLADHNDKIKQLQQTMNDAGMKTEQAKADNKAAGEKADADAAGAKADAAK